LGGLPAGARGPDLARLARVWPAHLRNRERRRPHRAGLARRRRRAGGRPPVGVPRVAHRGHGAGEERRRRRARLLRLEPPRQLRVGARLHPPFRHRARGLRYAGADAQAQRQALRRARRICEASLVRVSATAVVSDRDNRASPPDPGPPQRSTCKNAVRLPEVRSMRMKRALIVLSVLAGLATGSAQGLPRDVRLNIVTAVVQVIPYDVDAGTTVGWSGSG